MDHRSARKSILDQPLTGELFVFLKRQSTGIKHSEVQTRRHEKIIWAMDHLLIDITS